MARRRKKDPSRLHELEALRAERFELMEHAGSKLPDDTIFFTQITMEAAEDPAFLDAMRAAHIKGALIGVEAVTEEGLKDVYKGFNLVGRRLWSSSFGSSANMASMCSDRSSSACRATSPPRSKPRRRWRTPPTIDFAQFLTLTPFPGTLDFLKWEQNEAKDYAGRQWRAGQPLLADPTNRPAENLLAPSGNDGRANPAWHPAGVGPVLPVWRGLAPLAAASARSRGGWRSCWCRSSTGRCTAIPVSRRTAPVSHVPPPGLDGSPSLCQAAVHQRRRCPICRCRPARRSLPRAKHGRPGGASSPCGCLGHRQGDMRASIVAIIHGA